MKENNIQPQRELKTDSATEPNDRTARNSWLERVREAVVQTPEQSRLESGAQRKAGAADKLNQDERAVELATMIAAQSRSGSLTDRTLHLVHMQLNGVLASSKHLTDTDRMRGFKRFIDDVNNVLGDNRCGYRFSARTLDETSGVMGTHIDLCRVDRSILIDGLPLKRTVDCHDYIVKQLEK
jgi:hypothetical protein